MQYVKLDLWKPAKKTFVQILGKTSIQFMQAPNPFEQYSVMYIGNDFTRPLIKNSEK